MINPRHACATRVTVLGSVCVCVCVYVCVCVCVCVPVNRDLTSGVSVCPENDIMYSMGNEDENNCVNFSETAPLQRYTASCIVRKSAILEIVHTRFNSMCAFL